VGESIWYDTFRIQNTKRLWLVKGVVAATNSNKVQCGVFGFYPSFVAGTMSKVQEINFDVHYNDKIKYSDYIEKRISGKQFTVSFKSYEHNYFTFSSSEKTVGITFETRTMEGWLPSVLIFAYAVLNKIRLSSLSYGIVRVSVHNRVTHVLTSRHGCVLDVYAFYVTTPRRHAICKFYTSPCAAQTSRQ
jgi:hypothetical protein